LILRTCRGTPQNYPLNSTVIQDFSQTPFSIGDTRIFLLNFFLIVVIFRPSSKIENFNLKSIKRGEIFVLGKEFRTFVKNSSTFGYL
jgi:hypothetical protein